MKFDSHKRCIVMRRIGATQLLIVLGLALVSCSPKPYLRAQSAYFGGEPTLAIATLEPEAEKANAEDSKMKNLYSWDLGVYKFWSGDLEGARIAFMDGVRDKELINSGMDDLKAAVTDSPDQKYVGDPVEIATAYIYLALCFEATGDRESAFVALRRALEEDLSEDVSRVGDFVLAHFLMGYWSEGSGRVDDAKLAYRNALTYNPQFAPALARVASLESSVGGDSLSENLWNEVANLTSEAYAGKLRESVEPPAALIVASGRASAVQADAFLGAFRKRQSHRARCAGWQVTMGDEQISVLPADRMHDHLTTQGGIGDEARKQATRAVTGAVIKKVPLIGGFLAPDTSADTRYWATMPGSFSVALLPWSPKEVEAHVSGLSGDGDVIAGAGFVVNGGVFNLGTLYLVNEYTGPLNKTEREETVASN